MVKTIERITLLNVGDGLLADLISPYVDSGYTVCPVDNLGRVYEARRITYVATPPDGERMAA